MGTNKRGLTPFIHAANKRGQTPSIRTQMARPEELIYDWNTAGSQPFRPRAPRQSGTGGRAGGRRRRSASPPPVEAKIELLHVMDALGIHTANLGLPGAGGRPREDILRMAKAIVAGRLKIGANVACRTVV